MRRKSSAVFIALRHFAGAEYYWRKQISMLLLVAVSLLIHIRQLLLVIFCDTTSGMCDGIAQTGQPGQKKGYM